MKTQLSQWSDRPRQRYDGVYLQQGRMITDADWNEQVEHAKRALRRIADDAIGDGVPRRGGVLGQPTADDTAALQWGVAHVGGIRAALVPDDGDLTGPFDATAQADLLAATDQLTDGLGVYLDVWERTVVAIQDDGLVDPALAGADTASRQQVVAQLKQCPVDGDRLAIERPEQAPGIGNGRLDAVVREAGADPDPCDPCADELAVEGVVPNAMFRMEVHDVDDALDPRRIVLKWSMENGAEAFTVSPAPPAWFASGGYLFEVFNRRTEQLAGFFHTAPGGNTAAVPLSDALTSAPDPDPGEAWQGVRRWDGSCVVERDGGGWTVHDATDRGISLDSGTDRVRVDDDQLTFPLRHLEVRLRLATDGSLRVLRGDHWLVRVRAQPPPEGGDDRRVQVVSPTPIGIVHHYLPLGVVDGDQVRLRGDDERRARSFPPLTDLQARDVGYVPCRDGRLDETDTTVQKALDALCSAVDERPDDCAPRLALFGRGVVCGLIPTAGAARSQKELLAEELRRSAQRLRERTLFTYQPAEREEVRERREEVVALVRSDEDADNEEALRIIDEVDDPRETKQYLELRELLAGYGRPELGDGQAVRFQTTPGRVVDGHGCYHDVPRLTLTTVIRSFTLRGGSGFMRRELEKQAEEKLRTPPGNTSPEKVRHDLVELREPAIDRLMAHAPETEEAAIELLEPLPFETISLRKAVARKYIEATEVDRQPQCVTGWLYLVFPDGQPQLEFREEPPDAWTTAPQLLVTAHRREVLSATTRLDTTKKAVVSALVRMAGAEAATDDEDEPEVTGERSTPDRLLRGAHSAAVERELAARGGAILTNLSNAEVEAVATRFTEVAASEDGTVDLTLLSRALEADADIEVRDRDAVREGMLAALEEVGGVTVTSTASGEEVVTVRDPQPDAPEPADGRFGGGFTTTVPLYELLDVGEIDLVRPDDVLEQPKPDAVTRAWSAFGDVGCPPENDGSVCLGKVAAYGATVVLVPDDREQLLASPANVNAMVVRHLRRPGNQLFDQVMGEISGGNC